MPVAGGQRSIADRVGAPLARSTMYLVADDTEPREPDYRFIFANERTFLAWQRT
ncbi:MAG: putative rane protein [Mycobacterium sp.]|nr:putative rane protein [Mycobacterium sp.]